MMLPKLTANSGRRIMKPSDFRDYAIATEMERDSGWSWKTI
jgi:hypothetical protein